VVFNTRTNSGGSMVVDFVIDIHVVDTGIDFFHGGIDLDAFVVLSLEGDNDQRDPNSEAVNTIVSVVEY
jgi:hypothetical protein